MLGTSDTIRRGGRASPTATPDASTRAAISRCAGSASDRRRRSARVSAPPTPGPRPRLLHTDGRGELGPHADELLEDLPTRGMRDAAIDQITLEVRLDEIPAPRRNHCDAQCIMTSCG